MYEYVGMNVCIIVFKDVAPQSAPSVEDKLESLIAQTKSIEDEAISSLKEATSSREVLEFFFVYMHVRMYVWYTLSKTLCSRSFVYVCIGISSLRLMDRVFNILEMTLG